MTEAQQQLFIGDQYEYYRDKWQRVDAGRNWNWAAFFGCLFWLAYRKMYGYTAVFLSVASAEIFIQICLEKKLGTVLPPVLDNGINLAAYVALGFFGNRIYRHFCHQRIARIVAAYPTEEVDGQLNRQGGVSRLAPWLTGLVFCVLIYLAALVALN